MFVQVYLFMAPESYVPRWRSVDLTKTTHPISRRGADREDAIVIGVNREGRVFFSADPVRPSDLPRRIRERVSHGAERKIYINADARAKYAWVSEVLDSVHDAGIESIGFLAQRHALSVDPQ